MEFSKLLLFADYFIMIILIGLCIWFTGTEMTIVASAWIGQVGISSLAYYRKSSKENAVKIPIYLLKSLPTEIRQDIDLTTIITTIISNNGE